MTNTIKLIDGTGSQSRHTAEVTTANGTYTMGYDPNKSVAIYYNIYNGSTKRGTIVKHITHENWENEAIADICSKDYYNYIDDESREDELEMARANAEAEGEELDEVEFIETIDKDGIYFDGEFYCNPAEVNYIGVTDVFESEIYKNLFDLIEGNMHRDDIIECLLSKYEDLSWTAINF